MSNNQKPRTLSPANFLEFAKEMVAFEWHQDSDQAKKMRSTKSVASLEELGSKQILAGATPEEASTKADKGNVVALKKRSPAGK